MATEIIGTVLKSGKPKDYGHEENFGRTWVPFFKFYVEVDSEEQGTIKAMVEITKDDIEETRWGYKIKKDSERPRPLTGDKIRLTTHRLRENGNGDRWASVTYNQEYEILEENQEAREEREQWIAKKKQERKQEWEEKKAESKAQRQKAKDDRIQELENQRHDERLPEEVRMGISQTFDLDRIVQVLRDTVWFAPIPEGEGGRHAIYNLSGVLLEEGYPGTGMRRPMGCLYNIPEKSRLSILNKAVKSGLVKETDEGYVSTDEGVKLLYTLDRCKECGKIKHAYLRRTFHTVGGTTYKSSGTVFRCKHEIEEIKKHQNNGCNYGEVNKIFKIPERLAKLMED